MDEDRRKEPTNSEVKGIFSDTYLLYTKHIGVSSAEQWKVYCNDMRLLSDKYPFELASKIIVAVTNQLEKESRLNGTESELVKLIFRQVYSCYMKYNRVWSDTDWIVFVKEMNELHKLYRCDLCDELVLAMGDVVERRFMYKRYT